MYAAAMRRWWQHIRLVAALAGAGGALLLAGAVASGAEGTRHSGIVAAIDRTAGTLTLGEVGPWTVRDGRTEVTSLSIRVTGDTVFATARRQAGGDFPGGFTEAALDGWAVAPGDFVTAECRRDGQSLVAVKIVIANPREP